MKRTSHRAGFGRWLWYTALVIAGVWATISMVAPASPVASLPSAYAATNISCPAQVDMTIIIETSSRLMTASDLSAAQSFARSFAGAFRVGSGSTDSRIGVIGYDGSVHVGTSLASGTSLSKVQSAISGLGRGNLDANLTGAFESAFNDLKGGRNVPHLIMYIGTGFNTASRDAVSFVNSRRGEVNEIAVLGVTPEQIANRLGDIASPGSYWQNATPEITDSALKWAIEELCPVPPVTPTKVPTSTKQPSKTPTLTPTGPTRTPTVTNTKVPTRTRSATPTGPTNTRTATRTRAPTRTATLTPTGPTQTRVPSSTRAPTNTRGPTNTPLPTEPIDNTPQVTATSPTVDCSSKLDIVLSIDSSYSIGSDVYDSQVRAFASNFVDAYDVDADNIRIAVNIFADDRSSPDPSKHSRDVYDLGNYGSAGGSYKSDLISAINSMPYLDGGTDIQDGISLARDTFSADGRDKTQVKRVLVIVTDGTQTQLGDPINEATSARGEVSQFIVVGVGPSVSQPELDAIAGSSGIVLLAPDYVTLVGMVKVIVDATCDQLTPTPSPTLGTVTPTLSPTPTLAIETETRSPTRGTPTITRTPTNTRTATFEPTETGTPTITRTRTPTPTFTPTPPPLPTVAGGDVVLRINSTYDDGVYKTLNNEFVWPLGEVLHFSPQVKVTRTHGYFNTETKVIGWSVVSMGGVRAQDADALHRNGCSRGRTNPPSINGLAGCAYPYNEAANDPDANDSIWHASDMRSAEQYAAHVYWTSQPLGIPAGLPTSVYSYLLDANALSHPVDLVIEIRYETHVWNDDPINPVDIREQRTMRPAPFHVTLLAPRDTDGVEDAR